jgi:hypothetical protein
MRIISSLTLALLLACTPAKDEQPDSIGERFMVIAGGWDPGIFVELYRDGDEIELRRDSRRIALGMLTPAGLTAWDEAIASVDPALEPDWSTCAPVDGIDSCLDLELGVENSGTWGLCYCADDPPPALTDLDAYFAGLAGALLECQPSAHIVIDLCDPP